MKRAHVFITHTACAYSYSKLYLYYMIIVSGTGLSQSIVDSYIRYTLRKVPFRGRMLAMVFTERSARHIHARWRPR